MKYDNLIDLSWGNEDWSIEEFRQMIDNALAKIPSEQHQKARILFDHNDYGEEGSSARLSIYVGEK